MQYYFNSTTEIKLLCPEKYRGLIIAEAWFLDTLEKLRLREEETILPRLIELLNNNEIIILGWRTYSNDLGEIPPDFSISDYHEIIIAPGTKKGVDTWNLAPSRLHPGIYKMKLDNIEIPKIIVRHDRNNKGSRFTDSEWENIKNKYRSQDSSIILAKLRELENNHKLRVTNIHKFDKDCFRSPPNYIGPHMIHVFIAPCDQKEVSQGNPK